MRGDRSFATNASSTSIPQRPPLPPYLLASFAGLAVLDSLLTTVSRPNIVCLT